MPKSDRERQPPCPFFSKVVENSYKHEQMFFCHSVLDTESIENQEVMDSRFHGNDCRKWVITQSQSLWDEGELTFLFYYPSKSPLGKRGFQGVSSKVILDLCHFDSRFIGMQEYYKHLKS